MTRIVVGLIGVLLVLIAILRFTPRPEDTTPAWVFARSTEDVDFCNYAFGIIPVVARALEGDDLVWKYPGQGETRMKRICKLPVLNDRARALPIADARNN